MAYANRAPFLKIVAKLGVKKGMSEEADQQSRLSSAPLLEDDSSGSGMATADVSPVPKQLEIQTQPEEEVSTTTQPSPPQHQSSSLQGQESIASAAGGAKVNREHCHCTYWFTQPV